MVGDLRKEILGRSLGREAGEQVVVGEFTAGISQREQESPPTFRLLLIAATSNRLSLECGRVGVDFWAERKQYTRIPDQADGKQRNGIQSLIGKKEKQKCPSPVRASGEAGCGLGGRGWGRGVDKDIPDGEVEMRSRAPELGQSYLKYTS